MFEGSETAEAIALAAKVGDARWFLGLIVTAAASGQEAEGSATVTLPAAVTTAEDELLRNPTSADEHREHSRREPTTVYGPWSKGQVEQDIQALPCELQGRAPGEPCDSPGSASPWEVPPDPTENELWPSPFSKTLRSKFPALTAARTLRRKSAGFAHTTSSPAPFAREEVSSRTRLSPQSIAAKRPSINSQGASGDCARSSDSSSSIAVNAPKSPTIWMATHLVMPPPVWPWDRIDGY